MDNSSISLHIRRWSHPPPPRNARCSKRSWTRLNCCSAAEDVACSGTKTKTKTTTAPPNSLGLRDHLHVTSDSDLCRVFFHRGGPPRPPPQPLFPFSFRQPQGGLLLENLLILVELERPFLF
uniref:Uncharacterized protein n=1 Tax=Rhizophora mucronata TaxID=61149 RepID=A0A2P2IIJ5_RHIMU